MKAPARIAALVLVCIAARAVVAAEPDVPDSRDPYGLDRYPRSWIVEYRADNDVQPRDFIMSRVDRIRRNLRVEEEVRVEGSLESVTYQIPDGATVDDVFSHYLQELGGDLLFRCEGRGCGRSADWANQIFEQSILYGPDLNQRYAALKWQDLLVALYVIERGNKRVYAHLRFLEPRGAAGVAPNALLARRLSEHGWAVIEDVRPRLDGTLGASAAGVLGTLGERLAEFAGQDLHLVCHLYGPGGTEALMRASTACAEAAAALIAEGGEGEGGEGPTVKTFGAGPLLPRSSPAEARLELVLPSALDGTRR